MAGGAPSLRVRLPDGRTLAIEEYGEPDGPPVFYFHGWPACRLEPGLIPKLPVRLLAPDRPGYGHSSPKHGRTLLDWPADVVAAADQLGLRRFHVVGLSGGGPYAAACAAALPERVRSLTLVAPVPPHHDVADGMAGVAELFRFGHQPGRARVVFPVARFIVRQRLVSIRRLVGRGLHPADAAVLTPDIVRRLVGVWRESLRHGVAGAMSDARIYAQDWGFDLSSIRVPARLWCGSDDALIPPTILRPYAAIPGIRWHELPGEGHFSLPLRHAAPVLAALRAEEAPARTPRVGRG